MQRPAYAALILTAAVMLGACASPVPPAAGPTQPPSAPSPVVTPTPSPTPSPTAVQDPADPSTWLVTEAGIGPLMLNESFATAVAQLPTAVDRDPEECTHSVWWKDAAGNDLIIARSPAGDDTGPLELVAWADWTEPYEVGGPRTTAGIGVGSTVDEVWAAYPDAIETTDEYASDIHYIAVDTIFFYFRDPSTVINVVTVTNADQPPYEICG